MRSIQTFRTELSKDLSAWLRHDFVLLGEEYARHSRCETASLDVKVEIVYGMWPSRHSLLEAKASDFFRTIRRVVGVDGAGITILPQAASLRRGNPLLPVAPKGWVLCPGGTWRHERETIPADVGSVGIGVKD